MAETAVAPEPSATREVERQLGAFETEAGRGERLHRRRRGCRRRVRALQAAAAIDPDIVLLDIQLPDIDAARLAELPRPPAVVLSSTRDEDAYRRAPTPTPSSPPHAPSSPPNGV